MFAMPSMFDTAIAVSIVGLLTNAGAWFMVRRRLSAIARVEDQAALHTLRASEQKQARTSGAGVVGNLVLIMAVLTIAWWRAH